MSRWFLIRVILLSLMIGFILGMVYVVFLDVKYGGVIHETLSM